MRQTFAVVLIAAIVAMGAFVPFASPIVETAGAQSSIPDGFNSISDTNLQRHPGTPIDPSLSSQSADKASPPISTIPGNGIDSPGPKADSHPINQFSESSLDNIVTTRRPGSTIVEFARSEGTKHLVTVITDDTYSDSRKIGIPVELFTQSVGYKPQVAHGIDESGETWSDSVEYSDGYAIIEVPHFSTQTVTWSGEAEASSTGVSDTHQTQIEINDKDSVDVFNITLTGIKNYEWDNESGSNVGSGTSQPISPAGNIDPGGDSSNNLPTLEVSGYTRQDSGFDSDDGSTDRLCSSPSSDNKRHSEQTFDNAPATITHLNLDVDNYENANVLECDIYLVKEGADSTYGEGTLVKDNWDPTGSQSGNLTIDLGQAYDTGSGAVTIEFVAVNGNSSATQSVNLKGDSSDSTGYKATYDGTTLLDEYSIYVESQIGDVGVSSDGANSVAHDFGTFSDGQSKSTEFAVAKDATALSFNGSGGEIDYSIDLNESTVTEDPSIQVNNGSGSGGWANVTKLFSSGEAYQFSSGSANTLDESWVHNGTNNYTVHLTDPSADAPTMQVDMVVNHTASSDRSVSYTSGEFTGEWNQSKVFTADYTSANLTIPVDSGAIKVRSAEKRINGGSWSSISNSKYQLQSGNVDVDLGSISKDDKIEVRMNTTKVTVTNGGITPLNISKKSGTLHTRIKIDSWASDAYIETGGTDEGKQYHYSVDESWSNPNEHTIVTSGQGEIRMYLPKAGSSDTFVVKTHPIKANPSGGEVNISVDTFNKDEPRFIVKPGSDGHGSSVDYTFVNATSDTAYKLWSITRSVEIASGTASSPLTLTDDDTDEELQFQIKGSSSSSGSDDGGGGSGAATVITVPQTDEQINLPVGPDVIILLASIFGIAIIAVFIRQSIGDQTTTQQESTRDRGLVGRILGGISRIIRGLLVAFSNVAFFVGRQIVTGTQRGARYVSGSRTGQIVGVSAVILGLFATDVITLTTQERLIVLVAAVIVGLFVAMQQFDLFEFPVFAFLSSIVVILALRSLGSPLLSQVIDSPIFPILGVGGLYLAYRAIQAWQRGRQTTLEVEATPEDD